MLPASLPPIYAINLKSRPDRRALLAGRAQAVGISIEWVDAADAKEPDLQPVFAGMKRRGPVGVMGDGMLACALSHRAVWQKFLADPLRPTHAVVLEDDAILSADFATVVAALVPAVAATGLPLVKLEAGGVMSDGVLLGRRAVPLAQTQRRLRRCYQLAPLSAGYLIARDAAKVASQALMTTNLPIDHFLFYPQRLRGTLGLPFGVVEPAICLQDTGSESSIAPQRNLNSRWQRDLRRAPYEAAQVRSLLPALLFGKAWFRKVQFRK